MWNFELSPIKTVLFVILFVLSAYSCASEEKLVHEFAEELLEVVTSNNRNKLKSLPVYPNSELDTDTINYTLGTKNNPSITNFLKNSNILIKVYGPYSRADSNGHDVYSVVYYDPKVISIQANGLFDSKAIKDLWGQGIAETVLIVVNKKVLLHRTAFYYGSHAPWTDDY